jgi:multisubunit Na+/H+ antiporter MnhG subunit
LLIVCADANASVLVAHHQHNGSDSMNNDVYLFVRLLKLLGVLMFFSGIVGTFRAHDQANRRQWAEGYAAPGYVLTWTCGLGLASMQGRSLAETWIVVSACLGTASVSATLVQAHLRTEKSRPLSMTALLCFLGSMVVMVWKP